MTKVEFVATAATWLAMNVIAVLVALNPLPGASNAPDQAPAASSFGATSARA